MESTQSRPQICFSNSLACRNIVETFSGCSMTLSSHIFGFFYYISTILHSFSLMYFHKKILNLERLQQQNMKYNMNIYYKLRESIHCLSSNSNWERQDSKSPIASSGLVSREIWNTEDSVWFCIYPVGLKDFLHTTHLFKFHRMGKQTVVFELFLQGTGNSPLPNCFS